MASESKLCVFWSDGKIYPKGYYSINKKKDRNGIQGLLEQSCSLPPSELMNLFALLPWDTSHGSCGAHIRETDALARNQRGNLRDRNPQV